MGRPPVLESIDAGMAAVGGAVVDDPEDPAGRRVGLAGHDLVDQAVERVDAGRGFAAAEHPGVVDISGGQVGQRAAAKVLHFDAWWPATCRSGGGVSDAGLDGGFLVVPIFARTPGSAGTPDST